MAGKWTWIIGGVVAGVVIMLGVGYVLAKGEEPATTPQPKPATTAPAAVK